MTALPLRPALADVLCAISVCDPEINNDELRRLVVAFIGPHWPFCAVSHRWESGPLSCDWITRDPTEAFETLISRGVLPDSWAGDERRAFVCDGCGGRGLTSHDARAGGQLRGCGSCGEECSTCGGAGELLVAYTEGDTVPCEDCEEGIRRDSATGFVATPPTIPALVSWASLGPAAILRAEELARETVLRLRLWGAPQTERVVWRVGPRPTVDHAAWRGDRAALSHRGVLIGTADYGHSGPIPAACALWDDGLALDAITADAVTITVPPVGAP